MHRLIPAFHFIGNCGYFKRACYVINILPYDLRTVIVGLNFKFIVFVL